MPAVYIGCAGWTIPAAHAGRFPESGSHLHRYAQVFGAVEINSSFYRAHRPATYARWAASVPEDFRFAVKMPRAISHQARLADCAAAMQAFLGEVHQLGTDRSRLAQSLDASEGRAARLEEANKEVSRRLVAAMEVIREVLARHGQ